MMFVPSVRAQGCPTGSNTIILPFATAWGNNQPKGTAFSTSCYGAPQILASSPNFYNSVGSGAPSLNLAMASTNGFAAWGGASGFGPGPGDGPYLEANGYFGGSNSMGILRLFDNSIGDTGSHFRIRPHTFASIWYYHNAAGASQDVMVDGMLYNAISHNWILIGDFSSTDSNGVVHYIVDQNNVRMNAAYRGSDAAGSWQHAVFSLDPVYYSGTDRDNWYVFGIYVRSDNKITGSQGAAVTYFSDFRITYAVTSTYTVYDGSGLWLESSTQSGPFTVLVVAEAWYQFQPTTTSTSFQVKITVLAQSYASASSGSGTFFVAYPDGFGVNITPPPSGMGTVTVGQVAQNWYPPTGANLTSQDSSTNGNWVHFLLDSGMSIIGMADPLIGAIITAQQIATQAFGLVQSTWPASSQQLFYGWPYTDLNKMTIALSGTAQNWPVKLNSALGEVYMTIDSVPNGDSVSVPVSAEVQYAWANPPNSINGPVNTPNLSLGVSTVADSPVTPQSLPPQANFVNSNGGYVTSITFGVDEEMRLSTQVPVTTTPVSIQAFTNGGAGKIHPWKINETGWNYVLDFGPAPNLPGTYNTYTVVTFADGTTSTSNTVTATIVPPFAQFLTPSGQYVSSVTYGVDEDMRLSTQVPTDTNPVSVQAFVGGTAGSVHPWSTSSTGWNYIIDFGPANDLPGTYPTYTITTFADGTTSQSNTVTATIVPPNANFLTPSGAYVTSVSYGVDEDMRLSTQVPSDTNPVSVQAYINGTGASVHSWSTGSTGWNYIIDFGRAGDKPGIYFVYTITTFADGKTAQSNTVTATIVPPNANFLTTSGAYVTSVTYIVGQDMRLSTQVPTDTNPVSVQAFINGGPGSVHPWSTSSTGWNYIIDFGAAPNLPGTYLVYTNTTFADGIVAKSNVVTAVIANWQVSISSSATQTYVGSGIYLTGTANSDVSSMSLYIVIIDQTTGSVVGSCSSGTSCTVLVSQSSPTTQTYYAEISGPNGAAPIKATSATVTLSWISLPSGGGGGSVAYGSLVTLADGSRVPVQNLKVGDVMLGYNTTSGQFTTSTVLSIKSVSTTNMMIINTQSGVPFRVDANPRQTLWVQTPNGKTQWLPVTLVQPGDDLLTPTGWTAVTSIGFAPAGDHTMFDIVATMPYFTDNYLDPIYKT
jgi:hypothetical protein